MMKEKKITQKDALNYVLENCTIPEEIAEKLNAMLAQIEKKSASGKATTPTQKANAEFSKAIVEELTANPNKIYTITDIIKSVDILADFRDDKGNPISNQRVSAIVSKLVNDGTVKRIMEKRMRYFQIVLWLIPKGAELPHPTPQVKGVEKVGKN